MADEDRRIDPSPAQLNGSHGPGTGRARPAPGARGGPTGTARSLEGISENPEEDWGEPADEGAAYSANHATRGRKTDAQRGPGRKTRQATKDAISRRR